MKRNREEPVSAPKSPSDPSKSETTIKRRKPSIFAFRPLEMSDGYVSFSPA
jgi:hypothetical protein